MSEHTSGPWHMTDDFKIRGRVLEFIAQVDYDHRAADGDENAYANARLIAAAPEMLALLAEIDRHAENNQPQLAHERWLTSLTERARALLARIEGKPCDSK